MRTAARGRLLFLCCALALHAAPGNLRADDWSRWLHSHRANRVATLPATSAAARLTPTFAGQWPSGWSTPTHHAGTVRPRLANPHRVRQAEWQPLPVDQVRGAGGCFGWSSLQSSNDCAENDSRPPFPTVGVHGFFQADAGLIHQSSANRRAVGDAQDGADFRRARLWASGDVWDNTGYNIEFDFGFPGRPSFMDVWLELRELAGGANLRIGQYRQPIGMNGLNSVLALPFIERPLPFALLPFRQIGAMVHGTGYDNSFTWAASAFRFPTDVFGANLGDNGGYGMAGRLTAIAYQDGDTLAHLGGAFSHADPSDDAVQLLSPPEFFLLESGLAALEPASIPTAVPPFVNTGPIATDRYSLYGAEAAVRCGPLYVQSELLVGVVDQKAAGTAVFPGFYVHGGYFLTGEVRPYDAKNGVLGRVEPRRPFSRDGGIGAWEITARWSTLDLNDAGIAGGRLRDVTFGLNWYLNPYLKFQLNYIHASLDSLLNGSSDAGITAARAQLDF